MCTELPVNLDIQKGGKPNLSHRGSKEKRREGSGGGEGEGVRGRERLQTGWPRGCLAQLPGI